jgi:hypothetical protein
MIFVDLLMWLSPAGHDRLAASIPISSSRVVSGPDADVSFPIDLFDCPAADRFIFSILFRPLVQPRRV